MDKQLLKYSFAYTLELYPSAYQFGTDTNPPVYVRTVCKNAKAYLESEGVTLIHVKYNSYICSGIFSANIIRLLLADYWQSVSNQCPEN